MTTATTTRGSSARAGAVIFTTLSVVLAASGGWLMYRILAGGGYDREQLRPVVVAARSVGAGRPLQAEDLRIKLFPASSLPPGHFVDTKALLGPTPAVPTAGVVEGEPILKERIASPEAGAGLASLVGAESRAVTVQVDRAMAAARLVYPGARVDVMATLEDKVHHEVVTRTVLEDVRVLAIGIFADVDAARRGAEPGKLGGEAEAVVTLEVSPSEAEKLALSARQGKIDLALRNATDRSHTPVVGINVAELLQNAGARVPVDPEAEVKPVEQARPGSTSSHRKVTVATSGGAAPAIRSYPRPASGGDSRASSTIEVYSVPTQAR